MDMSISPNFEFHTEQAARFADWLHTERTSFIEAADALGGPKWKSMAEGVVRAIVVLGTPPFLRAAELKALRRLFRLDFVQNLGSVEARRFEALHPDSDEAHAARLAYEALDLVVPSLNAIRAVVPNSIQQEAA
ncbi:hypothetical protein [Pseudaestuariivita rosea]|uniref:hypothetical protein n=1 Tax=Pseudaestuariivita rosea TaxID=2763263 RepID=UPI001ABB3FC1|nr:hypothetical protein [Pseudaestuariivita rosea]